jgi:GTPase SAR1 family protein
MQELKITMLGSTGVGKTSLLTAMYDQFANNIGKTDLLLTPDEESSAILQERLIELKSLLDDFESVGGMVGIKSTAGVDPTNLKSFIFGLGRKGKSPSLQLAFRDYPGEYHLDKKEIPPDQKQMRRQFVKNLLTECVAVLVAIDAPALMEKNGKYHDLINRPQQIRNLFETGYQDLDSPRLVIFAPVRCEKYMQNEKLSSELIDRIKEEYKGIFDLFGSESLSPYISAIITPVQTVGSVVFSRIEMREDSPHFMFRKVSHDARYSPKDSEQPLRYLLRFLLKLHLSNNRNWGFFNFLRDIFGMDDALVKAIKELSQGCKSNGGFAILQGNSWLTL